MTPTIHVGMAVALVLSMSTLAAQGAGEWRPVQPDRLTPTQTAQRAQAEAARDLMFQRLMTRLQAVMADEGAAGAIEVCREEAPRITKAVRREHGVRIGRTSFKLRNLKNRPPHWAREPVARRTGEPLFLTHQDGRLAALLPIRLKKDCLNCHGNPAAMPVDVRAVLARRYPKDQATSFAEGDLRGWFWVEVPR